MSNDKRHEELINLSDDDDYGIDSSEEVDDVDDVEELPSVQTGNVSQWALLKFIRLSSNGASLIDICRKFNIEDSANIELQHGLGQLKRACRIVQKMINRDGRLMTIFEISRKESKGDRKSDGDRSTTKKDK